jgi:hypothetical protein
LGIKQLLLYMATALPTALRAVGFTLPQWLRVTCFQTDLFIYTTMEDTLDGVDIQEFSALNYDDAVAYQQQPN